MKILAPPSRWRHHPKPDSDVVRRGPAAVFDWGVPLKPMTMTQIAAQPAAEWEYSNRDATRVAEEIAANLAFINAALSGPDAHAAREAALPFAERIAALLGSTWDHRPVGKSVGRELGTDTPSSRLWPAEDFGPTAGPLAAEAAAQDALRERIFGTEAAV